MIANHGRNQKLKLQRVTQRCMIANHNQPWKKPKTKIITCHPTLYDSQPWNKPKTKIITCHPTLYDSQPLNKPKTQFPNPVGEITARATNRCQVAELLSPWDYILLIWMAVSECCNDVQTGEWGRGGSDRLCSVNSKSQEHCWVSADDWEPRRVHWVAAHPS